MALVGVELETLVFEPDAQTTLDMYSGVTRGGRSPRTARSRSNKFRGGSLLEKKFFV